jgi:hypothetical protein
MLIGPQLGWVRLADGRDGRTERRVFDERVVGDGVTRTRRQMADLDHGGRHTTPGSAHGHRGGRAIAGRTRRRRLVELAAVAPDRAERLVYDEATSDGWERATLVARQGHV